MSKVSLTTLFTALVATRVLCAADPVEPLSELRDLPYAQSLTWQKAQKPQAGHLELLMHDLTSYLSSEVDDETVNVGALENRGGLHMSGWIEVPMPDGTSMSPRLPTPAESARVVFQRQASLKLKALIFDVVLWVSADLGLSPLDSRPSLEALIESAKDIDENMYAKGESGLYKANIETDLNNHLTIEWVQNLFWLSQEYLKRSQENEDKKVSSVEKIASSIFLQLASGLRDRLKTNLDLASGQLDFNGLEIVDRALGQSELNKAEHMTALFMDIRLMGQQQAETALSCRSLL